MKDLNLRKTFCSDCLGPGKDMISMGKKAHKDTCQACGLVHFGGADNRFCDNCASKGLKREPVGVDERIPSAVLCDECDEFYDEAKDASKDGGIMFKCSGCGTRGVVDGASDFAKHVRADMKVEAPDMCGVTIPICFTCQERDNGERTAEDEGGDQDSPEGKDGAGLAGDS